MNKWFAARSQVYLDFTTAGLQHQPKDHVALQPLAVNKLFLSPKVRRDTSIANRRRGKDRLGLPTKSSIGGWRFLSKQQPLYSKTIRQRTQERALFLLVLTLRSISQDLTAAKCRVPWASCSLCVEVAIHIRTHKSIETRGSYISSRSHIEASTAWRPHEKLPCSEKCQLRITLS